MAYLTARMSTDAPLDDLQWDEEVYDAARMQGRDASCLACGLHMVTTAAVDSTGQLVAYTQIVGDATSHWHAWQWDTIRCAGTPRTPAGHADQGSQSGIRPSPALRVAGDRHLQRGFQLAHGRDQRGDGIPAAPVNDRLGA